MAEERIIAVCSGGPFDGMSFSTTTDDEGTPQPLASRAELAGVLYCPVKEIEATVDLQLGFLEESEAEHGGAATIGIDHDRAFDYRPFEYTVEYDNEDVAVGLKQGKEVV
jgi:hypothetical protein